MIWWAKYVGIPFVDGGRDISGVDCWGLVRLIYAERLGVSLPSYGEISAAELIRIARAIDAGQEQWAPVEAPRAFDVVLLRLYDRAWTGHVGVAIDGTRMLHTERDIASAVVPMDHYTIKHRIAGFRRSREAACEST